MLSSPGNQRGNGVGEVFLEGFASAQPSSAQPSQEQILRARIDKLDRALALGAIPRASWEIARKRELVALALLPPSQPAKPTALTERIKQWLTRSA